MTIPYSAEIFQYVTPGGQIVLMSQFMTYYGSGVEQGVSGTQITVTPVVMGGGTPIVGPTSAGIIEIDPATYSYIWQPLSTAIPGDYAVLWSAAGPGGTLTISQTVTVVALPSQTPSPGVYATPGQYTAVSGDTSTPAAIVTTTLRRSSEVIDLYAVGAVYETNANGMPTAPAVIDAFMRATCAQCQFEIANNDPARVKSQYTSISVGGVSLGRAAGAQMQTAPPLGAQAAAIMRIEGILGAAPLIGW